MFRSENVLGYYIFHKHLLGWLLTNCLLLVEKSQNHFKIYALTQLSDLTKFCPWCLLRTYLTYIPPFFFFYQLELINLAEMGRLVKASQMMGFRVLAIGRHSHTLRFKYLWALSIFLLLFTSFFQKVWFCHITTPG